MCKYAQLLRILILVPLLLLLLGCPYPDHSSRSSEDYNQLLNRFSQDYQPIKGYRILLIVPSHSYIDLFMVGGSLEDGPSPNIQMTLSENTSHKVKSKRIELNKVICFYVKPGEYDILFENENITPKRIEMHMLMNNAINIMNVNASGLYGFANLFIKQLQLAEALPLIYGKWVPNEKCLLLDK